MGFTNKMHIINRLCETLDRRNVPEYRSLIFIDPVPKLA